MSCIGSVALQAVPVLGSTFATLDGTGSDQTLVSAMDNVAGVLVTVANVWSLGDNNVVQEGWLKVDDHEIIKVIVGSYDSGTNRKGDSVACGPFIVPPGKALTFYGSHAAVTININYEVLS